MTHAPDGRLPVDLACHGAILVAAATPETLPASLAAIAALGYSRIVLPPLDPATTDAAALGRVITEHGLAPITMVGGLSPESDVGSADPAVRAVGADILRSVIDFSVAVGSDQVNGVPYGLFGHPVGAISPEAFARSAREVGLAADYAHDHGITLTFEVLNRYETPLVNTAEQAMRFVELSGSENLRIHLDTFHMAIEEADMAAAIRLALPKLGYLELGQSGRGFISTGVVDNAEVVRIALDASYTGRFGIEAFARSIMPAGLGDVLAIWRDPYESGVELAADAAEVVRRGHALSAAAR
jgi:D-psicose/D-tagatose/L-ribulose 3-epimerase